MNLGPGVTLVPQSDADALVGDLLHTPAVVSYVVDTFHQFEIVTQKDLVMAIVESMHISEWYSYDLMNVLAHKCIAEPGVRHCLVLVLTPQLLRLVHENLLYIFAQVHMFTQRRFSVFLCTSPLAARPTKL